MQPSNGPQSGDRIVRELDVVVCAGALGSGTQTVLLQYPLRGADRPYQLNGFESIRYKPQNQKLQVDVSIDTNIPEYNQMADPARQLKKMALESTSVRCPTSMAAAFVEGDRLILMPLDEAMHMRPSMAHLDEPENSGASRRGATGAAPEEESVENKSDALMPVMVQVRRRETEAQQEARLRSFAHLSSLDAAEEWVPLQYHDDASEAAQGLVRRLATTPAEPVLHAMSRPQYLAALVPPPQSEDSHVREMAVGGAATTTATGVPAATHPRVSTEPGSNPTQQQAETSLLPRPLPPAQVTAMAGAMLPLFQHSPVCSLAVLRAFLQRGTADQNLAAAVAAASDATLHASSMATGKLVCIRRAYLLKSLGSTTLDPLRDLVLELLIDRESVRRSEILEAAARRKIAVTDSLYSKVVRDICVSRGALWSLKAV